MQIIQLIVSFIIQDMDQNDCFISIILILLKEYWKTIKNKAVLPKDKRLAKGSNPMAALLMVY